MNLTPKISIVIPTYLRSDKLELCLESIVKFTDLDHVDVLVVCNGAPLETRTICHEYPVSYLWSDEPLGFSRACNLGIEHRRDSDFIVLLNDDVILLDQEKNTWLNQLQQPFADPRMGITGSLKQFCPSAQREFLLFFCVMIRTKMLDEIGVLDEVFGIGAGEDCDLSCRAVDYGWKIQAVPDAPPTYADRGDPSLPAYQQGHWVTSSPIYHLAGATVGKVEGFQDTFARNAEILRKRYAVDISRAQTIEGWMADSELEWLARQAKRATVFIEVGSWAGRSTRAIADNLPVGAVLLACDSWNGSSGEPDAHKTAKEREGDGVFMKFFANLYDHIRLGRVIPVRMDSANAADILARMELRADVCFIDGDHSHEGFKRDVDAFRPLVREGGLLCGHDYYLPEQNPLAWIGVREVVTEMFPDAQQAPNTSIWHVRPKPESAWDSLRRTIPVSEPYQGYGGFFT